MEILGILLYLLPVNTLIRMNTAQFVLALTAKWKAGDAIPATHQAEGRVSGTNITGCHTKLDKNMVTGYSPLSGDLSLERGKTFMPGLRRWGGGSPTGGGIRGGGSRTVLLQLRGETILPPGLRHHRLEDTHIYIYILILCSTQGNNHQRSALPKRQGWG